MPKDMRRQRRWRERIVPRVVRRDHGICHLCSKPGAQTADHLVPRSLGGSDQLDNLAAAHIDCNRRRGNRPIEVARSEIAAMQAGDGWDW